VSGAAKADIEANEITAMVTMSVTVNKARKTFFLAVWKFVPLTAAF
jgi:hypothetical protein